MSARATFIRVRVATSLALLVAPTLAEACAVCGGGNPANRFAFFASTIALSILPLGMFVSAFLWLRSKLADRGREEFTDREEAVAPHLQDRLQEIPKPPKT